jgi:hypothetical protein
MSMSCNVQQRMAMATIDLTSWVCITCHGGGHTSDTVGVTLLTQCDMQHIQGWTSQSQQYFTRSHLADRLAEAGNTLLLTITHSIPKPP